MGSRLRINLAYIAGFLDGDGSLMLQVKKRKDTKRGFRFMATIAFYQDSCHESPLYWIREVFGIGYISRRKDGITELRINGFQQILEILVLLQPYIRFKQDQVCVLIKACDMLSCKKINELNKKELVFLVDCVLSVKNANYKSNSSHTKETLYSIIGLTP